MPSCAPVDSGAFLFLSNMSRNLELAQILNECFDVIPFVAGESDLFRSWYVLGHIQGRLAFCCARGLSQSTVDDQSVPVLHQGMTHVAELSLFSLALSVKSGIGIGGRLMSFILALLPFEVDVSIAPTRFWGILVLIIFRTKAFQ